MRPKLWPLSSMAPTPLPQSWPWFHLQVETEYSFLDYVMGGCQINFTVSCFTRSKRTHLGLKVAFSFPPPILLGGRGFYRLQWRPLFTWLPALPEPNRGQRVLDRTLECGLRGSGLWLVSSCSSCPSSLPADASVSGLTVSSLPLSKFTVLLQGQDVPRIWIWGPGASWLAGEYSLPLSYLCSPFQSHDFGGCSALAVWHPALCMVATLQACVQQVLRTKYFLFDA